MDQIGEQQKGRNEAQKKKSETVVLNNLEGQIGVLKIKQENNNNINNSIFLINEMPIKNSNMQVLQQHQIKGGSLGRDNNHANQSAHADYSNSLKNQGTHLGQGTVIKSQKGGRNKNQANNNRSLSLSQKKDNFGIQQQLHQNLFQQPGGEVFSRTQAIMQNSFTTGN